MMRTIKILLVGLLMSPGCSLPQAHAQGDACPRDLAMKALDVAGGELATWDAVYQAYSAYGACDDGAIGEGFSDSVVKLLARRWDDLEILETLMGRDEDFREFVHRHIDASTDEQDLQAIVVNAKDCPPAFKRTCQSIEARARQALQSM